MQLDYIRHLNVQFMKKGPIIFSKMNAMEEKSIREKILEALKDNPQGITISEISTKVGANRVTISKYLYGLVSENIIYERRVGSAKLCCLKEDEHGK
jgi:predicted transcriptional regulator